MSIGPSNEDKCRDSTSGWQSAGEPLRALLMNAAQGGWMSLGIFLGWATGKSTRRGCPELFRIESLRRDAEEGRPEIECTGERESGEGTERRRGEEGPTRGRGGG